MTGRRNSRDRAYSLREIQFLRSNICTSMLDCNVQAGSHQAERMAQKVLDAYAQGVRSSEALREAAKGAMTSLERDTGGPLLV